MIQDEKSGGSISERRDTYLFGHPSGKRFRSPAEFVPHILHLAAQDDKPCVCWICTGSKHGNPPASTKRIPKKEADATQARRVVAVEERQKEQETAGWVLRKGEVIWVWLSDNPEAEEKDDDALVDGDGGLWVAGIVAERPSFTPPFQKVRKTTGNSFADIDMDDTPPTWQQEGGTMPEKTYIIQLCSEPPNPGQILKDVPQHHVKPWLSRQECMRPPASYSGKVEHPSIPNARRVAETFSLFDRVPDTTTIPDSGTNSPKTTNFQGAFIGAEKIYIHEPVRISSANEDESEDVLVVDKIYTSTTISGTTSSNDGKKKTLTTTLFQGNVYTAYPSTTCTPLTTQQFAELPFRMKQGSGTGEVIKWFIRNTPDERGECSLKMILGRWYEPQAVNEWIGSTGFSGGQPSSREEAMCQKDVKRWVKNRADALGLASVNGIDLKSEGEVKIRPGRLTFPTKSKPEGDAMDVDHPPQLQVATGTPERGFKSVNLRIPSTTPGVSPNKNPGVAAQNLESDSDDAEDDDDEEDEDDEATMSDDRYQQPGPDVLSRSPTKRLGA